MFLLLCFAVAPPLAGDLPSDRLAILSERRAPYRNILGAALSPDGRRVALGYPGGWVVLDARTYKKLHEYSGPEARWLAFDAYGTSLAFGNAKETGYCSLRPGSLALRWENPIEAHPRRTTISPNGKWIAQAKEAAKGKMAVHVIQMGHLESMVVVPTETDREFASLALSNDGQILAVGSDQLRLYSIQNQLPIKLPDANRPVHALAFATRRQQLAVLNPDALRIWDLSRNKVMHTLPGKSRLWDQIAWSADERWLAVTRQNTFEVFDLFGRPEKGPVRTGPLFLEEPPDQISVHKREVFALRNRGNSFSVTSLSGNALPGPVWNLAFLSDDELWAASPSGLTRWNVPQGRVEENLRPDDASLTKAAYRIDANSRRMQYRTKEGQWAAFDLTQHRPLTPAERDGRPLVPSPETPFAFSPDGRLIATVREIGDETRLQVRNAAGRTVSGWPIASAQSAFALGTGRVAIQNGQEVRIEPLSGTAPVVRIKAATDAIKLLALSRDDRLLAIATAKGNGRPDRVEVFEIATATRRRGWSLGDDPALALAFDPIGRKLAVGNENGTIEVFDLTGRSRREAPAWSLDDLRSPEATVAHRALLAAYQRPDRAVAALNRAFRAVPNKRYSPEQFVLFATAEDDQLPLLRAVEILEHLGTPEARAVLTRWAAGHPEDWLTRQAIAAVRRLTP
jgi:WD40 repeat protein